VANIGRCEAYERIAHLFCELFMRLKAIGLNDGNSFQMPITQSELADATGLSTVHVNRTMQDLRASGLIKTTKKGVVTEVHPVHDLHARGWGDRIRRHSLTHR